jgi:hypothetical protein
MVFVALLSVVYTVLHFKSILLNFIMLIIVIIHVVMVIVIILSSIMLGVVPFSVVMLGVVDAGCRNTVFRYAGCSIF